MQNSFQKKKVEHKRNGPSVQEWEDIEIQVQSPWLWKTNSEKGEWLQHPICATSKYKKWFLKKNCFCSIKTLIWGCIGYLNLTLIPINPENIEVFSVNNEEHDATLKKQEQDWI